MSWKQVIPKMKAKTKKLDRDRRGGFSLLEMLATMLILLMVSAIVAAGIPSAVQAYEKVTRRANAEMLLSTSVSALRDQLGTASRITVSTDKKTVTFFSDNTGSYSKIYPDPLGSDTSPSGVLMLQEYLMPSLITGSTGVTSDSITPPDPRPLVTHAAATKGLYITYDSISPASPDDSEDPAGKGILKIKNLKVCLKSSDGTFTGEPVTEIETLFIRPFGDMPTD